MAKYYVQSGTMRSVVQADSTRKAAIWAVHQAMQQVLPIENGGSPGSQADMAGGLAVLTSRVSVSERGFDRQDSTELATMEVVTEWSQMVTTLDRLEQMLYRAA